MSASHPRVLIACEHVSFKMGGEAARPLHYFRILRSRGVEAWLLVHDRTRGELEKIVPEHMDRIHFVADTYLQRFLWWVSKPLPHAVTLTTTGALSHVVTQVKQRREAKRLVKELAVDVVHEPIPISPKQPSMMFGLGAPVVIGPLNGGMTYPPAFGHMESPLVRASLWLSRFSANLLNRVMPGKLLADTVLVSNERTRNALPDGCRGRVEELVANAVDMATWKPSPRYEKTLAEQPASEPGNSLGGSASGSSAITPTTADPVRFAFLGRLVDFKMVDLLIEAFKPVAEKFPGASLDVIGNGPDRAKLEAVARNLGLKDRVTFAGWMSPKDSAARLGEADVLVFPSLRECGGAVVMEAMAVGLPVIAAAWGGPADYVGDDGSGILIHPTTKESFVAGFAEAMTHLAGSREARERMARAARHRAVTVFDWNSRVDRLLEIYRETIDRAATGAKSGQVGRAGVAPA